MPLDDIAFCLDECLPYIVAKALRLVGYNIDDHQKLKLIGQIDEEVIPWLAQNRYVWITKDTDAKKRHAELMMKNALSVVWIRGMDRKTAARRGIRTRDLHLMLTTRIDKIAAELDRADGPRHFELGMNGERPRLERIQEQRIRFGAPLPQVRRARRRRRR